MDIYDTTGFTDFKEYQCHEDILKIVNQITFIDPYKIFDALGISATEDCSPEAEQENIESKAPADKTDEKY